MPSFMAIVAPGLENIAAKELKFYSKRLKTFGLEYKNINTIKGGVEFESSFEQGLVANQFLKTPVRILYRWGQFEEVLRANDIEEAFQSLNWFEMLQGFKPEFHVSAFKSKMFHLQKLKQACEMSYRRVKIKNKIEIVQNRTPQKVYIRISKNKMTASLDTTGELLYKRGLNKAVNEAPLRESIASSILWWLVQTHPEPFQLLDPMCGSGTFLIESKNLFKLQSTRRFQYQLWPNADKLLSPELPQMLDYKNPIEKSIGVEISPPSFELLNENIKTMSDIKTYLADCTEIKKESLNLDSKLPLIILTNPPYEKRLNLKLSINQTLDAIQQNMQPKALYYIYPIDQHKNKKPLLTFRSGGLNLGLFSWS